MFLVMLLVMFLVMLHPTKIVPMVTAFRSFGRMKRCTIDLVNIIIVPDFTGIVYTIKQLPTEGDKHKVQYSNHSKTG